ncbi:MAG: hypothetical protein D6734_04475 [Candidatus Schekmanbacteria bacterium]|nr:MAG: hypothetical protein D6734_04475 [Candidatus Schekmanbacteria bacterium]
MNRSENLYNEIIHNKILEHIPKIFDAKRIETIQKRGKIIEEEAMEIASMREAPSELLGLIAKLTEFKNLRSIRQTLFFNPKTPIAVSKSLIGYLDKRELIKVLNLPTVPYSLKNIVLEYLKNKLPEIPLGEKISLARKAPRKLLLLIIYDDNEMVFEAALWNPKLTEMDLLVLLQKKTEHPSLTSLIAGHPKWKNRYRIKTALVRNPSTPFSISEEIIPQLMLQDLRILKSAPGLDERTYKAIRNAILVKIKSARKR